MIRIASHVRKGAMAYLKQQYKVVAVVFLIITLVFAILSYGLGVQNGWLPAAFLMGGFFSGLAGYFGMKDRYLGLRAHGAGRYGLPQQRFEDILSQRRRHGALGGRTGASLHLHLVGGPRHLCRGSRSTLQDHDHGYDHADLRYGRILAGIVCPGRWRHIHQGC